MSTFNTKRFLIDVVLVFVGATMAANLLPGGTWWGKASIFAGVVMWWWVSQLAHRTHYHEGYIEAERDYAEKVATGRTMLASLPDILDELGSTRMLLDRARVRIEHLEGSRNLEPVVNELRAALGELVRLDEHNVIDEEAWRGAYARARDALTEAGDG